MIYFFFGTDQVTARAKWRAVGESFASKYPTGSCFVFEAENFNPTVWEELAAGADLFGDKRLVLADRVSENPEAAAFIETHLAELVAAPVVFACLETSLAPTWRKKLEQAGAKLSESKSGKVAGESFNPFALSDAVLARDRKALWLEYQKLLALRLAPEEIFWKLVWPVKNMLLVKSSGGGGTSRLSPGVASRARSALSRFADGEVEELSGRLVRLWHETKEEGGGDFAIGLEQLILTL